MNEIEAIKELERTDRYITRNPTNYGDSWGEASDAIDLAIEALKEKQERDKGCEYCKQDNGEEREHIIFGYCPKCGRKLVCEYD